MSRLVDHVFADDFGASYEHVLPHVTDATLERLCERATQQASRQFVREASSRPAEVRDRCLAALIAGTKGTQRVAIVAFAMSWLHEVSSGALVPELADPPLNAPELLPIDDGDTTPIPF